MAKTAAQRQAEKRKRKSAGGLFNRLEFWVHDDDKEEMRRHELRLRKKRLNNRVNYTR